MAAEEHRPEPHVPIFAPRNDCTPTVSQARAVGIKENAPKR
jgi:hypothetical protein